jgi:glycerol-3-phosphate acyltransferase PlsY
MLSIETIAVLIIGYLIGSIPWAVIIARRAGVDIFSVGSGNPGATNVLRTLGKPTGYLVFALDFLKGVLAVWWFQLPLFSFSGDSSLGLWALPAAVLGHTYPIFTRFRGGKGVATAMGGLLGLMPACLLVGLFVWVLTFYLTKYVAVASIAFGLSLPVCSMVFSANKDGGLGKILLSFLVMGWIIWRHRSNLSRLRSGTENRFEKSERQKPKL